MRNILKRKLKKTVALWKAEGIPNDRKIPKIIAMTLASKKKHIGILNRIPQHSEALGMVYSANTLLGPF